MKIEDIPEKANIYVAKDIFGYRIIYPLHDENGKTNWMNMLIGGWRNFIFLIIILLLAAFVMWAYNHDITILKQTYSNISSDPWEFCRHMFETPTHTSSPFANINLS